MLLVLQLEHLNAACILKCNSIRTHSFRCHVNGDFLSIFDSELKRATSSMKHNWKKKPISFGTKNVSKKHSCSFRFGLSLRMPFKSKQCYLFMLFACSLVPLSVRCPHDRSAAAMLPWMQQHQAAELPSKSKSRSEWAISNPIIILVMQPDISRARARSLTFLIESTPKAPWSEFLGHQKVKSSHQHNLTDKWIHA